MQEGVGPDRASRALELFQQQKELSEQLQQVRPYLLNNFEVIQIVSKAQAQISNLIGELGKLYQ